MRRKEKGGTENVTFRYQGAKETVVDRLCATCG